MKELENEGNSLILARPRLPLFCVCASFWLSAERMFAVTFTPPERKRRLSMTSAAPAWAVFQCSNTGGA